MAREEMSVDTSELEGFAAALEKLPDEFDPKMIDQAASAGAEVFLKALIERAPVRADMPSPGSTGLRPFWVKADMRKRRAKDFPGWIIGPSSATAYVVRFLEYGHMLVRGGKRGRMNGKTGNVGGKVIGHVPAHPFVRPAFDTAKGAAIEASKAKLAKLIADYWKKAESGWRKSA
jgi:HK97 gp10 family phage protein